MYYDDMSSGVDNGALAPPTVQSSRRESVAPLSQPNGQYVPTFDGYNVPTWPLYPLGEPNVLAQQDYYRVNGESTWDDNVQLVGNQEENSSVMYLMPNGLHQSLLPVANPAEATPSTLLTPDNIGWGWDLDSAFDQIPATAGQVFANPAPMTADMAVCPSSTADNPYPYHQNAQRLDDASRRPISIPERGGGANHLGSIAQARVPPGHFAPNVTRMPFPGHATGIARGVSAGPAERLPGRKPGPSTSQPGVGSSKFVDAETVFATFEHTETTAKIEMHFPIDQRPQVDGTMYKCRLRHTVPQSGPIRWKTEQSPCGKRFKSLDIWRRHVITGHLGCSRGKAEEGNDLVQGSEPTKKKGRELTRKEMLQRRRARARPSGSQPIDARKRRAGQDTEQELDNDIKFHPYKRYSRSG